MAAEKLGHAFNPCLGLKAEQLLEYFPMFWENLQGMVFTTHCYTHIVNKSLVHIHEKVLHMATVILWYCAGGKARKSYSLYFRKHMTSVFEGNLVNVI